MSIVTKKREDRPNTYTAAGGKACQLVEKYQAGCLKNVERTFEQALQCQQMNSLSCLVSMEDSAFVIHSPLGCSGCVTMFNEMFKIGQFQKGEPVLRNAHFIVTNLDESDIVYGGERKLEEAIRTVNQRYSPKLIFLFTSCASGIIGDDVDATAAKLQAEIDAVIIPIHCEGFKSRIMSTGYDAVFNAIRYYLLKNHRPEKDPTLINIFAPTSIGIADQKEIARLLGVMGLRPNYIPFYASIDKLMAIPTAIASASVCQVFADNFMQWLKDEYDIPYSITGMPLGVRSTDEWLRGIARLVGKEKEIQEYITKEHDRVGPSIAKVHEKLDGKTAFICAGTGRSFAAAALIEDYGMKLIGMQTPHYEEVIAPRIEQLIKTYGEELIIDIANMQPFEQVNLVSRLKPDIFIGMSNWTSKLGVPTTHVLEGKRPTMGYDGILYLGKKITDAFTNPGLNQKLARHRSLPYREEWYGEDPFKYVKDLQEV